MAGRIGWPTSFGEIEISLQLLHSLPLTLTQNNFNTEQKSNISRKAIQYHNYIYVYVDKNKTITISNKLKRKPFKHAHIKGKNEKDSLQVVAVYTHLNHTQINPTHRTFKNQWLIVGVKLFNIYCRCTAMVLSGEPSVIVLVKRRLSWRRCFLTNSITSGVCASDK